MPLKKNSIHSDSDDSDIDHDDSINPKKLNNNPSSDVDSVISDESDNESDNESDSDDSDDDMVDEEDDKVKMKDSDDDDSDDDSDIEVESENEDLDTDLYISDTLNDVDMKKTHEKHILLKNTTSSNIRIVKDEEKITKNIVSNYELTKIISERANSIENGAIPLVKVDISMTPQEIAYLELKSKRCPYLLYRDITFGRKERIQEEWDVNQMIIPQLL